MKRLTVQVFLYFVLFHAQAVPTSNLNGVNPNPLASIKPTDELACKMDDGRIEIPINGKIRSGANPCKVCTCTVTGFLCEDQCETIPASTSLESTTTTSTTTTTFSPDQFLLSSPSAPAISSNSNPIGNPSSNTAANKTANDDSDTNTKMNSDVDSCARASTHCATSSREYAFSDCSEIYLSGKRNSGIYEIWPRASPKPFRVYCDMETDGGGWTIIQRRGDYQHQSNFFVNWSLYKRGFGDLSRDFWLGNEKIYALTNQDEYRLHIDLEDFNDQTRFVDYEWFFVTNEQTKYILNLGRYMTTSTGGDSLSYNRGMRFTTRDQDNDQSMSSQCAENYKSGWWHAGCTLANLNGLYLRGNDSTATGVFWNNWLGAKYSLKSCEMKIRPTGFSTEMLL